MKRLLFSTVAVLALAMPAMADTFTYDGFTIDPANAQINIQTPVAKSVLAGQITLDGAGANAGQRLMVWCLDLIDQLQTGPYTYQITNIGLNASQQFANTPVLSPTQLQQIGDLMIFGDTGNDLDRAATQLAIWRVEFGNSFTTLGLSGTLDADAVAQLASVQPGGTNFNTAISLEILHDAVTAPNQTLGTAVPVPAPIVGAGLPGLFGLFGIWYANRRRRSVRVA